MKIEKIVTKQGHPVPNTVMSPRGPFPPELLEEPRVVYDYAKQPENGDHDIPVEGTAQNDYKEMRWFKCNYCGAVISETQLEIHLCE